MSTSTRFDTTWTAEDNARLSLAKTMLGTRIAIRSAQLVKLSGAARAEITAQISEIYRVRRSLAFMDIEGIESLIHEQAIKIQEDRMAHQ